MAAPLLEALAPTLQRFLRNYSRMVAEPQVEQHSCEGAAARLKGCAMLSKLSHMLINCLGLTFHPVHNLLRRPLGYRLHDLVKKKRKEKKTRDARRR